MKLALAAVAIILAALAISCGDGSDTLTLEEYFAEFEAMDADADAQFEEAFAQLFPEDIDEEVFFSDDANLPLVKEVITAFPRITAELLARASDLDPPSEVEEEHDEMIAALEELLAAFEEGVDTLDDAETFVEFDELSDELDTTLLTPAEDRVDQACLDVVAVGDANGFDVSAITCVDE